LKHLTRLVKTEPRLVKNKPKQKFEDIPSFVIDVIIWGSKVYQELSLEEK